LQHEEADRQFRALMDSTAKTEEEKAKIGKQKSEFLDRWQRHRNDDFDNRFLPKAKYLRSELLARLPPQPKNVLIFDELLFGSPAGVRGIIDTADRLDAWAKKLCP